MLGYRCTGCRREVHRRKRVHFDDPQAPFGPEWLCPDCGSRVILDASSVVVGLAAVLAGLFGFAVGDLWSRW